MSRRSPLLPSLVSAACIALAPATTVATFDLTGNWRITCDYFCEDGSEPVAPTRILQDGTALRVWGRQGTIDIQSGHFHVPLIETACASAFGIFAQATDNDHFSGTIGGFHDPLGSPCHVAGAGQVRGERVGLPATATPTATLVPPSATPVPPQCVGDCDGNGRATIAEIIRLVRCSIGICLLPAIVAPHEVVTCADANDSGAIEVSELVAAVDNVLRGCPSQKQAD